MLIQAVCRGRAGRHVESSIARSQRSPVRSSPRVFWPAAMACPPRPSASGASAAQPYHSSPRIAAWKATEEERAIVWASIDVLDAASVLLGHRHERLCTVGQLFGVAKRLAIWAECEGRKRPLLLRRAKWSWRGAALSFHRRPQQLRRV